MFKRREKTSYFRYFFLLFVFGSTAVFGELKQQDYVSLIQAEIKRNFDEYQTVRKTPTTIDVFLNSDKYCDFYTKKFVVTKIIENKFGGIWATIEFPDSESHFQLWLYEIDKDQWQLRSIQNILQVAL